MLRKIREWWSSFVDSLSCEYDFTPRHYNWSSWGEGDFGLLPDYPTLSKNRKKNTVDDMVKAAVDYAEGITEFAEELLAKWYESERTAIDLKDGLKEYSKLDRKYQEYRSKLARLKDR
jgi:hypothetical protein